MGQAKKQDVTPADDQPAAAEEKKAGSSAAAVAKAEGELCRRVNLHSLGGWLQSLSAVLRASCGCDGRVGGSSTGRGGPGCWEPSTARGPSAVRLLLR